MKKMNIIQKFVLAGFALMSFGLSDSLFGVADNVNPLTGQTEENRSCFLRNKAGHCSAWKVLVDGKSMVEFVEMGDSCGLNSTMNGVNAEARCKGSAGAKCVCLTRIPL